MQSEARYRVWENPICPFQPWETIIRNETFCRNCSSFWRWRKTLWSCFFKDVSWFFCSLVLYSRFFKASPFSSPSSIDGFLVLSIRPISQSESGHAAITTMNDIVQKNRQKSRMNARSIGTTQKNVLRAYSRTEITQQKNFGEHPGCLWARDNCRILMGNMFHVCLSCKHSEEGVEWMLDISIALWCWPIAQMSQGLGSYSI